MSTLQDSRPAAPAATQQRLRVRAAAAVGLSALLVGAVGGYLLRAGTEPIPKPRTVTKTVTAPAYTTSTTAQADVRFDGGQALYSGPAEPRAGATLSLRFTTTVPGGTVVISRLDPAPTWEQLTGDIATANSATDVMPLAYVHNVASRDGSGTVTAALTRSDLYSVWAGPLTAPGGPTVALATVLRVTP